MCWFRIADAGFADGDEHGVLKGETWGREAIIGVDDVTLFRFSRLGPPNGHRRRH